MATYVLAQPDSTKPHFYQPASKMSGVERRKMSYGKRAHARVGLQSGVSIEHLLVRLGNSGLKISKIVLGCMTYGSPEWQGWVLGEEEGISHIKAAYDQGINAFDTANVRVGYIDLPLTYPQRIGIF
jgi:hypothetical protein